MTKIDWHVSYPPLHNHAQGETPDTPTSGLTVREVAESILGYRLNPAEAASAMGAWLYAEEDLRIAESLAGVSLDTWPEY